MSHSKSNMNIHRCASINLHQQLVWVLALVSVRESFNYVRATLRALNLIYIAILIVYILWLFLLRLVHVVWFCWLIKFVLLYFLFCFWQYFEVLWCRPIHRHRHRHWHRHTKSAEWIHKAPNNSFTLASCIAQRIIRLSGSEVRYVLMEGDRRYGKRLYIREA